jgi:phosphohistidine phosphatase
MTPREPTRMTLYLVRHGIAEERGPEWPDDSQRPLTAEGASRMRRQTSGLAAIGVRVDRILSSPLVRTRQTAEILSGGLPDGPAIELVDALAPGGTATAVVRALATYRAHGSLAVVGHEPDMGALAAHLIGARAAIAFKKGAVCRIDVDGLPPKQPGRICWFLTPRILRRIT